MEVNWLPFASNTKKTEKENKGNFVGNQDYFSMPKNRFVIRDVQCFLIETNSLVVYVVK